MSTMTATRRTSLSVDGPKPDGVRPHSIKDYDDGLHHPPHIDRLDDFVPNHVKVVPVSITVDDGPDGVVTGYLHLPPDLVSLVQATHHRTAVILLSGAGGGINGPSSIYLSLACKLATLGNGIPALRLDYRYPTRNSYCVSDVRAAMGYLEAAYGTNRFILVGWSFGSAPVFTVGGSDHRVIGCATIASQMAEIGGIKTLAPTPVLLLHGKDDRTLSYTCSERLFELYGEKGQRGLGLFGGGNHALTENAARAEGILCSFIDQCVSVSLDKEGKMDVLERDLVEKGERVELMRRGGDLYGPEKIE